MASGVVVAGSVLVVADVVAGSSLVLVEGSSDPLLVTSGALPPGVPTPELSNPHAVASATLAHAVHLSRMRIHASDYAIG